MLRYIGGLLFTVTVHCALALTDTSALGTTTLQEPVVPFVPVTLKVSVSAVALKLRFVMLELLFTSTSYDMLFDVTLKVLNGVIRG